MTETKTADPETTAQPVTTEAAPSDTTLEERAAASETDAAAAEAAKPAEGEDWPALRASVLKRFQENPDVAWEFSEAEEFKPVFDAHTRRVHEEEEEKFRTALTVATHRWESGNLHPQLAGYYGNLLEKLDAIQTSDDPETTAHAVAGAAKLLDKLEALSAPYSQDYHDAITDKQKAADAAHFRSAFLDGLRPRERDEMERFFSTAKDWESVLKQYVKLHEPKMRAEIEGEIRERVEAEERARIRAEKGEPVAPAGGGGGVGDTWRTKAEARALHVQGKISNAEMKRIRDDPSIPD